MVNPAGGAEIHSTNAGNVPSAVASGGPFTEASLEICSNNVVSESPVIPSEASSNSPVTSRAG
jgi:hypothetical protein